MWITGILDVQFITFQAPVVQKLDSAIHRINLYPVDNSGLSFDEFAFVVTTVTAVTTGTCMYNKMHIFHRVCRYTLYVKR